MGFCPRGFCPTLASAERSFSGLHLRLNNVVLCHVHKGILDQLDVDKLMMELILKTDSRRLMFGKV